MEVVDGEQTPDPADQGGTVILLVARGWGRAAESVSGRRPSEAVRGVPTRTAAPGADPTLGDSQGPDPHEWAREIVLRLLTSSPKTRRELAQALARRRCDPQVAQHVLDRLQEVGLIDDTQFAADFLDRHHARAGMSARAISHKLLAKGVDGEIVDEVLRGVDPQLEEARARDLAERRLRSMSGLDVHVQTRRLAGMLARKGFAAEMSRRVIREVLAQAPEHHRD